MSGMRDLVDATRAAIAGGFVDEELDTLLNAIRSRKIAKSAALAGELRVGSHVRLANISPKMLEGALFAVSGFDGDWIKGSLSRTYSNKWRAGHTFKIMRSHIGEIVSQP